MASAKAAAGRNQAVAVAFVSSILVVLGVWFWSFASPDRLLERSYSRVTPHGTLYLDDTGSDNPSALRVTKAAAAARAQQPLLVVDGVAVPSGILSEPLTVGERVRISTGEFESREMEVQEVTEVDTPVVGLPGLRLQLVAARPVDRAAQDTVQLIFAIRDAEPAKVLPVSGPVAGRTL